MGFRKKNLDYEILKAVAERKLEYMQQDAVYIFLLMEQLFPKSEFSDAERTEALKTMWQRVEYLAADGLIRMGSKKIDGYSDYKGMIQSITPEGRVLLERMENNRFSRRLMDWLIGGVSTVVFGAILAVVIYKFGIN